MPKFQSNRKQIMKMMDAGARKKAARINNLVRNEINNQMAGPKTGREYKIPGTNSTYIASAPGEYPAVRTAQLRSGIFTEVVSNASGVWAILGTDVEHAVYLEGGLRPFISITYENLRPQIEDILSESDWFS